MNFFFILKFILLLYIFASSLYAANEFVEGKSIVQDMIEKKGEGVHPRLIMTQERFDALKKRIGDGSITAKALTNLKVQANSVLKQSVQDYEIIGFRLLEASKRITRRVMYLSMAYNIFGDEKYAERAYAELEAASQFKDWNPMHFLDPSEMVLGFAFGYDWLYNWMTLEQRKIVKNAIIEKGLKMAMYDFEHKVTLDKTYINEPYYRTYKWYEDVPGDNWKMICNGGMAIAALAIGDESDAKEISEKVLTYTFEDAYTYIRRDYSEIDGFYREGLGYWDYATYHLGMYSSSLVSATGSDYNLANYIGVKKSAEFLRYMSSNTYKAFAFDNDWNDPNTDWRIPVLLWLGDYFKMYEYSSMRVERIKEGGESYMDLLWLDEEKMTVPLDEISTDWGVVGGTNASFRNSLDKDGIIAVYHVGENNFKYNLQYDLGAFYIESEGERFFGDLGPEQYELPDHQYCYRKRAEGHNTLVINPSEENDQKDPVKCLINQFKDGNVAFAVSDLTEAYEPSGAKNVVRGVKMIKDKKSVIIQDEITLEELGEIYWFAHTRAHIDLSNDKKSAVLTLNGKKLWVGILSDKGTFDIMNAELLSTSRPVANQTDNGDYKKLAIHLTDTKNETIAVVCTPLNMDETKPEWIPELKKISEWNHENSQVVLNHTNKTPIQVYPKGQSIIIENANDFYVNIYDLNGVLLERSISRSYGEYYMPNNGLYIVKIGRKIWKVIVK